MRPNSKHTADEAAVDTEGRAVDRRCERAAYVGDEVRTCVWIDETFDQRSGPIFPHEAPFRLFEGEAGEDVLDEFGYPWGLGRARHDRVDGNRCALGKLGETTGPRELHGFSRPVVGQL